MKDGLGRVQTILLIGGDSDIGVATAKAFGELASAGKDSGLEAEFAQLEGHTVDADLEALKRERRARVEIPKELLSASRG